MHLVHAAHMVFDLDAPARGRTGDGLFQVAALEAQLVNTRLLIDFLADEASKRRDDVTAHEYLPSWAGIAGDDLRARLDTYRQVANKHVAHLTWTRVKVLNQQDPDLSQLADDLRIAYRQFHDHLSAEDPQTAQLFAGPLS